jgi:Tfp pilus assembly protein PilF
MAAVLLREGRAAEAERAYREAVRSDPKNPEVLDGLGSSLLVQGHFKEALDWFDRAIRLAPEKASYRINRGLARLELGRFEDAEEDFHAADSSPIPEDRMAAAINRGRLKQRRGDFRGAEAEFSSALARDPSALAALLGRGVARESLGELEPAAQDYLEAVRIHPRNAEANLRLGLVLMTLKRGSLGCRYLERTVEIDPSGDAGARARLILEGQGSPCARPAA